MSRQDLTVAAVTSQLAVQPANLWGAPTPAESLNTQQGKSLHKLHRLLRGRYALVMILAVVCAVAGGLAGFLVPDPQFRSDGLIQIKPNIPDLANMDRVMPMYSAYVESQAALIRSERVMEGAISSDGWKSTGRGDTTAIRAEFYKDLDVQYIRNTSLIRVSYTDENAKVAQKAVKAVITAYKQLFYDMDNAETREMLQSLEARRSTLSTELRAKKDQILALGDKYGTSDLEVLHNAKQNQLVQIESMLNQAEFSLAAAQGALQSLERSKDQKTNDVPTSVEEAATRIADVDHTLAVLLEKREEVQTNLRKLTNIFGTNHHLVKEAAEDLASVNGRIEKRVAEFKIQPTAPQIALDGTTNLTVTPGTTEQLKSRVEYLRKFYEREKASNAEIGQIRGKIQSLKNDIEQTDQQLIQTAKAIDRMNVETMLSGRLQILSYGDTPLAPALDKRKQLGVLGFLGGGALPFLIFILIGLVDQRYRFSDDPPADMQGLTLLGILPNLPERLSDPEQAAVAAHCVHQIRTMLQINGSRERNVFAITSASPGDGKTSLSLALGLSFAASGSRTLLIDCDLVGGGLSARLGVSSPEGVLEAINGGRLESYIRTTEVGDLAILPVGSAHPHHASTLSPTLLRRLVSQAQEHFDTILIDTGPILGSLEASLVATCSDAVILTVARGQQRPLVQRSLAHLNAIGARLAGVVFNRAQAKDFGNSISRMSLRSIGRTTPSNREQPIPVTPESNRLGPVARAVVSTSPTHNSNVQN